MRRAAIVAPVRTPVGKFLGSLKGVAVEHLAATVVNEVVARSKIDPALIEDVVFAQSYANGETPCVGRWAALQAGLPIEVPGLRTDRRCGGGLQAIATAKRLARLVTGDKKRTAEARSHAWRHGVGCKCDQPVIVAVVGWEP